MNPKFGTAVSLLALAGCADLTVTQTQVVWNDQIKVAAAAVANVGSASSSATLLYFNGDENPESPNYRPQVRTEVGPLAPGQTVTRTADFTPLARAENQFLGNVFAVTAHVDPKNDIRESNENNNTRQQALAAGAYTCIDFNAFTTGTIYGTPAGQAPGAVAFTQGAVRATVENFSFVGGGGAFNFARIDAAPAGFGSGNVMRFNNINLDFDFTGVSPGVKQVIFRFADSGGLENLAVNGSPTPIYAGELTAAPSPMGGAVVTSTVVVAPSVKRGALAVMHLPGTVGHLRVGGQELQVDDICFK